MFLILLFFGSLPLASNSSGSGTSVTVNLNSTSSSTSSVTNTGTNTTTSLLPIFVFSNGTFAFPFFGFNNLGFNNFGLNGLIGIGQIGGLIFGRSFTNSYYAFLQSIMNFLLRVLEPLGLYESEEDDGDYVFMEPDIDTYTFMVP